jgi:nucleotide-binding universal stress UspA family protein
MQKILVPTDYSNDAKNAAIYALEIAAKTNSEIIFLHTYHVPVFYNDSNVYESYKIILENIEKEEEQKMKVFLDDLMEFENGKFNSIDITSQVKLGFLKDITLELAQNEKIDLIVMGTRGASGIKKALIGSNTSNLINESNIPVLAVPENSVFKGLDRIVFACDYHLTENENKLYLLTELALLFGSEILIFNVIDDQEKLPSFDEALQGLKIENILRGAEHSYHFANKDNRDISEIIDDFLVQQKADMLVTIPKRLNFINSLFHKSLTKEMVCHSKIPLLALPE